MSVSHPKDLTSVTVLLERTRGDLSRPAYYFTLHGTGVVEYNGSEAVPVRGHQTTTLPTDRVIAILQELDRIGFMSMDDTKFQHWTDAGEVSVRVSVDGKTKTVHSSRIEDGIRLTKSPDTQMQNAFLDLADKIDALSESARWTKCSPQCTLLVVRAPFWIDSRAPDGSTILLRAIQLKTEVAQDPAMIFDAHTMIEAGVDVNTPNHQGLTPLMAAASNGDADLVRELLAHGAVQEAKDKRGRTALKYASNPYESNPEVRSLLSHGATGK